MKTSRFENTIRRKLESIEPDFQEADWARMQNYMQAHTPPSLWQQYGSWIGYAAAASVTTVMAFLYTSQRNQNQDLVADVKQLKTQIENIQNQPAPAARPDTIYIVQQIPAGSENAELDISKRKTYWEYADKQNNAPADQPALRHENHFANANVPTTEQQNLNSGNAFLNSDNPGSGLIPPALPGRVEFSGLVAQAPVNASNFAGLSRKMNYNLASRLSTRQVNRLLYSNQEMLAKATALPVAEKQVEKTNKAETVIPQLNINKPYRFGAGLNVEGDATAKTVLGEVLVAKKFSISAGISWLKVKPMEFFSEKVFREKIKKDFRRDHPGEVPLALDVYNIKVNPTLVQIPLTVAFRNNIKDNWAYYASVGTNVKLSSREKISYDCIAPNKEYFNREFERKNKNPSVNSMNISMGIEKTFHPIVVQAEGYLYTYFTPLTPLSNSTGPGVKVKVLYQIGGKL